MGVVDGHVPAAADAQIGALWGDDVEFVAVQRQTGQNVGGAVSGVVIHHNDVILE